MIINASITEVSEILSNRRPFIFVKTWDDIPYYITMVEVYSDGGKTGRELSVEVSHVYSNIEGVATGYKLLIPGEIEIIKQEVNKDGKNV